MGLKTGIQVNQINFESEVQCTLWGKVFVHNGFYHCDIQLSVYQLFVILKHHDHIGKLLNIMIKQDYQNQMSEFPNFIDIEAKLGNGILLLADELKLEIIKTRRSVKDNSVHYAMKIIDITKMNKLQTLRNTTQVVRMTSMPNERIVPDADFLKNAYSKYRYYHSLDMHEALAKSKSGLENPYIFKMAEYYHSA